MGRKLSKLAFNLGRRLLVGAIFSTNISFNMHPFSIPKSLESKLQNTHYTKPNEISKENLPQNMIYTKLQQDSLINLDFLTDTAIHDLNGYELMVSEKYHNLIFKTCKKLKQDSSVIEENLVTALIHEESSFNKDTISSAGAAGLTQVMKDTWYDYSKKSFKKYATIPKYNIEVGIKHLFYLENFFKDSVTFWKEISDNEKIKIIASAYNGGQNRLKELGYNFYKMPKESRKHGIKVLERYNQYKKQEMKEEYFKVLREHFQETDTLWGKLDGKSQYKILKSNYKQLSQTN